MRRCMRDVAVVRLQERFAHGVGALCPHVFPRSVVGVGPGDGALGLGAIEA